MPYNESKREIDILGDNVNPFRIVYQKRIFVHIG